MVPIVAVGVGVGAVTCAVITPCRDFAVDKAGDAYDAVRDMVAPPTPVEGVEPPTVPDAELEPLPVPPPNPEAMIEPGCELGQLCVNKPSPIIAGTQTKKRHDDDEGQLYRTVSPTRLYDIEQSGGFRPGPGTMETKLFATSQ